MKEFAYLINYQVTGKILWEKDGFYKISFLNDESVINEIFLSSEIKMKDSGEIDEMFPIEIKKMIKKRKLRIHHLDKLCNALVKFDRTSQYEIINMLKDTNIELYNRLSETLKTLKINI
jgi:hypothetical protein